MTNLEWIRTLSEEEFADWLYDEWLHHLQYRWSSSRGGLIIWLKDRKTENSSEIPNNCKVKNYCDDCLYRDTCDDKEFFYACTSKATISKMEQVDEPHIVGKHADAIIIDESRLMAKCLNCANGGSYKCSKCDGEMYFSKMYFKEEPKDEPQTDCAWK